MAKARATNSREFKYDEATGKLWARACYTDAASAMPDYYSKWCEVTTFTQSAIDTLLAECATKTDAEEGV